MGKITFRGAGINAASMLTAVNNANDSPSKKTLPAGATWPFVRLTISDEAVDFRMPGVHKSALVQDVKVQLSWYGYVFFHTPRQANDFGFMTPRLDRLIAELGNRGYHLGESVESNKRVAKLSVFLMVTIPLIIFVAVNTLAVLKPHGV